MELNKIIHWLYSYSKPEQALKDYYNIHGTIMPEDTVPRSTAVGKDFPRGYENDLRNAIYQPGIISSNALQNYNPLVLNEPQLFSENSDIFIHKHPRYSAVPMHRHQFFEIVYVYEGSCTQKLQCLDHTHTYTMKTGDFLFIPVNQEHALYVDNESIIINIGIRTSTFEKTFLHNIPRASILGSFFSSLLTMPNTTQFIVFHTDSHFPCKPYIHKLFMSYCSRDIYAPNILNLQLSLLFLYLLQEYSNAAQIINAETDSVYQIPAMIAYMENNYADINVKAVANYFGYSTDHLNRIFKQCTAQTVSETLMNIKMKHAGQLLDNHQLSVSDIAAALGYKDTTNFIRNFKKHYHMTPKAFRDRKV